MVNRLLYNMQILIQKVIIKMQQTTQVNKNPFPSNYLSQIQFQITNLHLRNSLVLLQANIIKKIFNLEQIFIKHRYANVLIKDFNICLDYNNKKVNIIAILGKISLEINQIPFKQLTKLFNKNSKANRKVQSNSSISSENQTPDRKRQGISLNENKIQSKKIQKSIHLNIYTKINHAEFLLKNLFSLKGEGIQLKFKSEYQNSYQSLEKIQKKQTQLLFKSIVLVHNDENMENDFIVVRYLPSSRQVKTFSEYQDNNIKSSLIKLNINTSYNQVKKKQTKIKQNEVQIKSSTSFQQKVQNQAKGQQANIMTKQRTQLMQTKRIVVQLSYIDFMVDIDVIKKLFLRILQYKQLSIFLCSIKNKEPFQQKGCNKPQYGQQTQLNSLQQIKHEQLSKKYVQFIFYRMMITAKVYQNVFLKLYGSVRGKYQKHIINCDFINEQNKHSIYKNSNSKDSFCSQQVYNYSTKHKHKKRSSNKQSNKQSHQQINHSHYSNKRSYQNSTNKKQNSNNSLQQKKKNSFQIIKLQLLQLCVQYKKYKILNIGNLQLNLNKYYQLGGIQSQIIVVGSIVDSNLSLKLIKQFVKLGKLIEKDVKYISAELQCFLNNINKKSQNQSKRRQDLNDSQGQINKIQEPSIKKQSIISKTIKNRVNIFLKMNQINIKFGSLIKINQNQIYDQTKQKFIWIFMLQLSNISLGIKNFNTIKLKSNLMIYLTSPQTLHRNSLTNKYLQFGLNVKTKKSIQLQLKNDFTIDIDENSIQILLKYFEEINSQKQREEQQRNLSQSTQNNINQQNSQLKINTQTDLHDNQSYFISFYNTLQKQINFIQFNQYETSEDSLNLSQFNHHQIQNQSYDYNTLQRIIKINKHQKSIIFWLNQYNFILEIDQYKSLPINLQFQPIKIKNTSKQYKNQYCFQYQTIIQFQKDNQKMENKYCILFLFNSIQKIEKIVLKYNVCLVAFRENYKIKHLKSDIVAYSNLVLEKNAYKINQEYLVDQFRIQNYQQPLIQEQEQLAQINFQLLLDLNDENDNVRLSKVFDHKNLNKQQQNNQPHKQYFKISPILTRSPTNKTQDGMYSLYGIYFQKQLKKTKNNLIEIINHKLFTNYLYQIKHLNTYYFAIMPFLIIQNNLDCQIQLEIIDKKSQIINKYKFKSQQKRDLYPYSSYSSQEKSIYEQNYNLFDFYNKQFTMKLNLLSKKSAQNHQIPSQQLVNQNLILYSSQQHYFNTFFMVEHQFQTLITLRSTFKSQFDKRYVFLKQQLMLKTKILKIQPCTKFINKTNFNFGLKFKKNNKIISGLYNVNNSTNMNINNKMFQYSKITTLPDQIQNNHYIIGKKSQINLFSQLKSNQTFEILFENLQFTKVQIKQQQIKQSLFSIISFNFAKKDIKFQQLNSKHLYCRLLFRIKVKLIENHQFIIIEDFVVFKNLSQQKLSISSEQNHILSQNQQISFPLPPTTNKKYNNSLISLNNISQIQTLYEQLFNFQTIQDKQLSINKNKKSNINIQNIMDVSNEFMTENLYLKIQNYNSEIKINFKELLHSKNSAKQVTLGKKGIKMFSLLKDIKSGIIRLYFIEKHFNPNSKYLIIQNSTQQNFLVSSDRSQYSHHFKKISSTKQIIDISKSPLDQRNEKIFIESNSYNILSNKQKIQLFLCDQNSKHLQKSTKQNLQKLNIQTQFHSTGNFQFIDIIKFNPIKQKQILNNKPKLSIKTKNISLNINLYNKLSINLSIQNLLFRILDKNKIDCLIQDIDIKNSLTNQHILRIPQQSYILLQTKTIGTQYSTNFHLLKNIFIKCKNIILNIEKDLPFKIICLCRNLLPHTDQNIDKILTKKQQFDNQVKRAIYDPLNSNQGLEKVKNYLKQKLFLIKNIYIHQIHLSFSLDLENNNFSNVMVIPQYQLTNSFMRQKNLFKEIGQFYKTNILAKLPKLSFIFQNIKNPINLFKTMIKVGGALNQKIQNNNILSFNHDEIPQNSVNFSLQRWNLIHKKLMDKIYKTKQNSRQQLLMFLYKNQLYYILSNQKLILISLNAKNIPKDDQSPIFVHFDKGIQQQIDNNNKINDKWIKTYQNSMIRIISLKDLQKIKLIRNKKYSEFNIKFKRNLTLNICDQYQNCIKLIDAINSLVM